MIINILGTDYAIEEHSTQTDAKLKNMNGYCDTSIRLCVVDDMSSCEVIPELKSDLKAYKRQIKRHELIHAFLSESGLDSCSDWATNEEMVDWLAIQFPKLVQAFKTADCL